MNAPTTHKHHKGKIAVLGGSSPVPDSAPYQAACQVGRRLAESGWTVISGGYIGSMEAVSRGACEAGGHVIGFKCKEVEAWKDVQPNPWAKEIWPCDTMLDLFLILIRRGDAILVLDGGVGTLVEVSLAWNQRIIRAIEPKPLILVGERWQTAITTFCQEFEDFIPEAYLKLLHFAPNTDTALSLLSSLLP
jgi:hypothetical protein